MRYVHYLTQKLRNLFIYVTRSSYNWIHPFIFYDFRSTNELNIDQYFCTVCGKKCNPQFYWQLYCVYMGGFICLLSRSRELRPVLRASLQVHACNASFSATPREWLYLIIMDNAIGVENEKPYQLKVLTLYLAVVLDHATNETINK